jgi:hypothetical protein
MMFDADKCPFCGGDETKCDFSFATERCSQMADIEVEFLSHNRKAKVAPNPAYPDGMEIDLSKGATVACFADLPYPAECCGILFVRCRKCGANAAITAAGRADDPRRVKLACRSH